MKIRLANAPVSWGVFEFEGVRARYTPEHVLDEIARAGYRGTELGPWGFLPTEADALGALLTERKLQLLSAFVPVRLVERARHADGEAHALRVGRLLKELGALCIVLSDDNGADPERTARAGRITPADGLDAERWQILVEGVNHIARQVHDETGLDAVFHHHCAGWIETPDEVARLLDDTDPELVGLCLDTGHYYYGGGDPVEAVRQFGERVRYLHFKDVDSQVAQAARQRELGYMQAVEAGVFCPLGAGAVDFAALQQALEDISYNGWAVVEQDILDHEAARPYDFAVQSRAYLQRVFGENIE